MQSSSHTEGVKHLVTHEWGVVTTTRAEGVALQAAGGEVEMRLRPKQGTMSSIEPKRE